MGDMGFFVLIGHLGRDGRPKDGAIMAYNIVAMLSKIEAYLDADPTRSLAEIAADSGVHRQTVERAIFESTGLTFREFRKGIILKKALSLLNGSEGLSCKQIAFRLGYKSPAAFARFVRRATGDTPRRNRSGKEWPVIHHRFPNLQHSA